jgi:hypothetical protein
MNIYIIVYKIQIPVYNNKSTAKILGITESTKFWLTSSVIYS